MRSAILILAAACSGSTATATGAPRRPAAPATARAQTWSVAFERSIGVLATAPVFAPDGGWVSSGQRFDQDGRYLGLFPIEVGGGRMIANVRALLSGGRALVEASGDGDLLLVGRADRPPEEASARGKSGWIGAIAVSPNQTRAASYDGTAIQIWSLPRLERLDRIELEGSGSYPGALAFLPDGSLVYSTPCRGAGCSGAGLEVQSAAGVRRRIREGGIDSLSLASGAALLSDGSSLEVIALPGGAPRGRIALPGPIAAGSTESGALAIDRDGTSAAALVCDQLLVWTARGARGWQPAYSGRITHGSGEDHCAYPSGIAFSPDGSSLALVARDLTVLRPGPARPAIEIAYRAALPAGFEPAAEVDGIFMPPPGTGLAPAPRVIGTWSGGGATARVIAREAAEMSGFADLDAWAGAILTRFEPMVRDDLEPNRIARNLGDALPYRRAFVDPRGRRVLEYTLLVRGGCEEMDRHVRWIEDGAALVEIDVESVPGIATATMRSWLAAFFDAPLGAAAAVRRIASRDYNRGPC